MAMTWREVCEDKSLADLPYKIELNRFGQIVMSPTRNKHGYFQAKIAVLLQQLVPEGRVLVECAVDTPEGTKVADVAWATVERFRIIEDEFSSSVAPQICVEVWSQSNTREEIDLKRRLCTERGATEFWYCDQNGDMTFFDGRGKISRSTLCPVVGQRTTASAVIGCSSSKDEPSRRR